MIEFDLKGPESQKGARSLLVRALNENRFPQSVLIEGERGIGKKALALELVRALCCKDKERRPCGKCFGCKMAVDSGNVRQWVIPLETKEASAKSAADGGPSTAKTVEDYTASYVDAIIKNPYSVTYLSSIAQISVEQIRSANSQFSTASEGTRCVIIAEADRMNDAAANALLKTLEEVPPNTYFILTSSVAGRLLQTIRSRCLSLRLPPLSETEVKQIVLNTTGESISRDALGMSLGSPGMAMYYGENLEANESLAFDFLRDSVEGNYSDLFFDLDASSLKDPDDASILLDFVAFLVSDALCIMAERLPRLPDRRETLEKLNLSRFGVTALEKALLSIQATSEKIIARKNSPIVALQALSIELFEGYKV
ncbi:MAG: AAA family ATPase [Fibrobacteraceae bacterium]|nr:AAA family ATPase [Fibrobacteraceae bacterium]